MPWFKKKPVMVEAVQYPGMREHRDAIAVLNWLDAHQVVHRHDGGLVLPTLEGDMRADPGDWIIRGVQGEFYPCKPDIFAATYEPVSTTGDVSSPPSSESSASEASRLLTERDAAPEQDFRVRFIPSDERTAREQAFNGGNYPQAEHWRLLRLALSEIDCLREDGQALVESNREARRLALERYEGLLAAEAALVARDAELAEAHAERDRIVEALPFGDVCGRCAGAAEGNPVGPCENCGRTGTEPDLATSVEDQFRYFERKREAERERAEALEAEVTQLRAERGELHERWLGMRDCYDREVRRVGRAERLAHDRGETLERIAKNAAGWHGPEPDMGHVRALAVIASWAGVVPPEQAPEETP